MSTAPLEIYLLSKIVTCSILISPAVYIFKYVNYAGPAEPIPVPQILIREAQCITSDPWVWWDKRSLYNLSTFIHRVVEKQIHHNSVVLNPVQGPPVLLVLDVSLLQHT